MYKNLGAQMLARGLEGPQKLKKGHIYNADISMILMER